MKKKDNEKIPNHKGLYRHINSGHIYARKKIKGEEFNGTFPNIRSAKHWMNTFNGQLQETTTSFSTLKEVMDTMRAVHFPMLASSTQQIWERRYELLKTIEHLPMNKITPSVIKKWVQYWVDFYKSPLYQESGRGSAARCNLNNELNLFVTIFNWYKESEEFEHEAIHLTNPIKKKHRVQGFIKQVPQKKKQISLEHALTFFEYLKPLYRNLAQMQFFTAGRVGEVAGIQWYNVDFENRRLKINETCIWCNTNKTFIELKPFPKNKEARYCYINDDMLRVLREQEALRIPGCNFVFHVDGKPLNYGTIQVNYRGAQRKGKIPYSGSHILRHGMAKLARQVGGLEAVMAMTGHKDIKLADHYSKCDEDDQKEISLKIFEKIKEARSNSEPDEYDNVISLSNFSKRA